MRWGNGQDSALLAAPAPRNDPGLDLGHSPRCNSTHDDATDEDEIAIRRRCKSGSQKLPNASGNQRGAFPRGKRIFSAKLGQGMSSGD